MTKAELAKRAAEECASAETTAHHGGGEGRPFWNAEASQFMYVPAFQFPPLRSKKRKYKFTAVDCNGVSHTFTDEDPCALLTPIWKDLPEGVVTLTVKAVSVDGSEGYTVGTRTFFRLSPFTDDLPEAKRSYKEAAAMAYDYAMNQEFMRHWLTDGTPYPDYDFYVYPTKMISSIINAMVSSAEVSPETKETSLAIATSAADYLIGCSFGEGHPLEGLPPTYKIDFREKKEKHSNLAAEDRIDTMMMIYPAHGGNSYLNLYSATGDKKYLDAAVKIGEYYRTHVQENGSWYLIVECSTGKILSPNNYCEPLEIIAPFLMSLYEHTGNEAYKTLADNATAYTEKTKLANYEWEAQFEDSFVSANYSNLTHYGACALIRYYAKYFADDKEHMDAAKDLMRFVEDQFVVWKNASPWNRDGYDTDAYHTPSVYEQYLWYVPIDSSTADVVITFNAMYKATGDELYLAKAKALADSITRAQNDSGLIPTHWMEKRFMKGENFWINCMFNAANALAEMSEQ